MSVQVTVWPRGSRRVKSSGPLGVDWDTETRRVGSPIFASDIGHLVDVSASTRYEDGFGGHDLASWAIAPLGGYVGGMFRPGDHVRITKGGGTVFEGEYSEASPAGDGGAVTMHARGYGYNLYDYDSIFWDDVSGSPDIYYPTSKLGAPDDNIEPLNGWGYAVYSLGMPINQVVGNTSPWLTNYGATAMAEGAVKVGDVLTAIHREQSERWAVWGRTLVIGADDMDPIWLYDAPDSVMGVADTDYATHVFVWYVEGGPADWANATPYVAGNKVQHNGSWWQALVGSTGVTPVEGATWTEVPKAYRQTDFSMAPAIDTPANLRRFDVRTTVVDYRGLGRLSSVRAGALAQTLLDQVKGRFTLSGSFTVGPDSGFKSIGGGRADIAFVRAGRAVRLAGLRTSQGNLMPDGDTVMIGKTDWSWSAEGDERLTVTPMGATPRNFGDILRGAPLDAASVVSGVSRR